MRALNFNCDRCGKVVIGILWEEFKKLVEKRDNPCKCHKMSKEDQEHNKKFIAFYENNEDKQ